MQEYLHQLKIIADQLATCGAPVSEEHLILRTLSGLPSVYRPFQTSIRTRSCHDLISLEELHTLRVCEELSLADDVTAESSTAFAASKSSFPQVRPTTTQNQYQRRSANTTSRSSRNSGHRQNSSFDLQGQRQQQHGTNPGSSRPRPQCQVCGKMGHLALDCFHRMDFAYQGRHPPQRLAAMVASQQSNSSSS